MATFAITYDLNKHKDYETLWAELKRLQAHKAAESFYLANINSNSEVEVRDHLKQYIDEDDTLIVVKFSTRPACRKARLGTSKWLDENGY